MGAGSPRRCRGRGRNDGRRGSAHPALLHVVVAGALLLVLAGDAVATPISASGKDAEPSGRGAEPRARAVVARRSTIVVYGDSLMRQALDYLRSSFVVPGWRIEARAFPGVALCDIIGSWFDADAALDPSVVVIETSGNLGLGGGCTSSRDDQAEVYLRDSRWAAAFWQARGARVLWVDVPHTEPGDHPLVPILQDTAARFGQTFAFVTVALRGPDGSWPARVPCSEAERAAGGCELDGRVPARQSPSNAHLCPVDYPGLGSCPVYSGGIVRWIDAILAAARAEMSLVDERRR